MGRPLRSVAALGVCSGGLLVAADWLFYDQTIGWTIGLFTAAVVAAIWSRRGGTLHRSVRGAVALAMAAGLVVAMVEYPSTLAVLMAIATVITLAVPTPTLLRPASNAWIRRVASFLTVGWTRLLLDCRLMAKWLHSRAGRSADRLRGVIQWGVAAGLSLVFVALFYLANPVISGWFDNAVELFESVTGARVILWLLVFLWSWALLRGRGRRRRSVLVIRDGVVHWAPKDQYRPVVIRRDPLVAWATPWLTPPLVTRCLVAFNAVFAVQTVLDIVYLFGGAELPDGMTYAHYAHCGAYPLIVTALLAALFVLVTFRPGSRTHHHAWRRRLVYVWLGQNVFLTIGSLWRLGLYVDVYSLTRWRLAAGIWMGLVAVGLVLIVARIVAERTNAWLIRANTIVAAGVLYACSFLNLDGFIAMYNVRHCRQITGVGQPLDLPYLKRLGPDALPALDLFLRETQNQATGQIDVQLRDSVSIAMTRLKRQLELSLEDWRGWSHRRQRLADRFLTKTPESVVNSSMNQPTIMITHVIDSGGSGGGGGGTLR